MNKKQLICMWIGIILFVLAGLDGGQVEIASWETSSASSSGSGHIYFPVIIIAWITVAVITAGLIYTFKSKK